MTTEIIGTAATTVTFIALALAVWQLRDARSQARSLTAIHRSLSTRYVGLFPEYLSQIADLIDSAKQSITVFCDFPAYGCFSNPEGWLLCRHAYERKLMSGVNVTLMSLSESARRALMTKYYGIEWFTHKNASDGEFRSKIEAYLAMNAGCIDGNDVTVEQLTAMFADEDRRALAATFSRAQVVEISEYVPLYFWIVDNRQAMFAFPGYTDLSLEYGFSTTDQKLLTAFFEVVERYR